MVMVMGPFKCREIRTIRAINYIPKNPCIPPKYSKCPHFGKLREIHRPFLYLDHEEWKPQISQQVARNSLNLPITTANDAKST